MATHNTIRNNGGKKKMAKEKNETNTQEEQKNKYQLGQYATQTEQVIINTETEETMDQMTAMLHILNVLEKINKSING